MAPDLLYFLPYKAHHLFDKGWTGLFSFPDPDVWRAHGPPLPAELVEAYHGFYVYTHSLVILSLLATFLLLTRRRSWIWFLLPCLLHILMDIPTHERYLTPVFYPFWDWKFEGLSWSDPRIFWPNLTALIVVHGWIQWYHRRFDGGNLVE